LAAEGATGGAAGVVTTVIVLGILTTEN